MPPLNPALLLMMSTVHVGDEWPQLHTQSVASSDDGDRLVKIQLGAAVPLPLLGR